MRVLLLICHADTYHKATAFRIADVAKEVLEAGGNEVRSVYLVEEGFDRVLTEGDFKVVKTNYWDYPTNSADGNLIETVTKQHANLDWATHVLIIGPMWYYRYPACVDAFIERVLTNYGFEEKGKKLAMVVTTELSEQDYTEENVGSLEMLLYSTHMAFKWHKFEVLRPLGYYRAGYTTRPDPNTEKEWIAKFRVAISQLDKWQKWGTNDNKPPLRPDTIVSL